MAATVGALAAIPDGSEPSIRIVDTHQHLWDTKHLRPQWLPGHGPLAGDHTLERYLQEAKGLGIEKTLFMEVDMPPEAHVAEAEYVLSLCGKRGSPLAGVVIGGRPASESFPRYMERFRGNRWVKGLRQVLHGPETPRGYCLRKPFVEGIRMLGKMGLAFDVCLPAGYLADAAALADACPETRLILDHCGNPNVQLGVQDSWKRAVDAVSRRTNVACKISGIVATAKPGAWSPEDLEPFILHCRQAFGPDRILFGSDWPVCTLAATLRQWVTALRQIIDAWPVAEQRKLLHDNAVQWYRLT